MCKKEQLSGMKIGINLKMKVGHVRESVLLLSFLGLLLSIFLQNIYTGYVERIFCLFYLTLSDIA